MGINFFKKLFTATIILGFVFIINNGQASQEFSGNHAQIRAQALGYKKKIQELSAVLGKESYIFAGEDFSTPAKSRVAGIHYKNKLKELVNQAKAEGSHIDSKFDVDSHLSLTPSVPSTPLNHTPATSVSTPFSPTEEKKEDDLVPRNLNSELNALAATQKLEEQLQTLASEHEKAKNEVESLRSKLAEKERAEAALARAECVLKVKEKILTRLATWVDSFSVGGKNHNLFVRGISNVELRTKPAFINALRNIIDGVNVSVELQQKEKIEAAIQEAVVAQVGALVDGLITGPDNTILLKGTFASVDGAPTNATKGAFKAAILNKIREKL